MKRFIEEGNMKKGLLALLSATLVLGIASSTFTSSAIALKESDYQKQKPMTSEITLEGREGFRRVLKITDQDVINLVAKEKNIKPEEVKFLDTQLLAEKAVEMTAYDKLLNLRKGKVLTIKESELVGYDIVKINKTYLKNFKYIDFEKNKRLTAEYMSPIGYYSEYLETEDLRPSMAYTLNGEIFGRYFPEKYIEGDKPSITSATGILSGTWYKVFLSGLKGTDNYFIAPPKRDLIKIETREGAVAGIKIIK